MRRALLGLVLLAGCPAKPPITTVDNKTTPPPSDGLSEGDGWTRNGDGTWTFDVDHDAVPTTGLVAAPGARGIERIPLPKGATTAKLVALDVAYTTKGTATWIIRPPRDDDWYEEDAQVSRIDVGPPSDAPVGAKPVWFHEPFSEHPVIDHVLWFTVETPDGKAAVGAIPQDLPDDIDDMAPGAKPYQVPATYYLAPDSDGVQTVRYVPLIRATIMDVH